MKKNKIGTIFLISMLALAGVGISYAGLTDKISIYGTVTTGTVDLTIEEYSGTWVWKVYDDPDETVITHDSTVTYPEEEGMLVAYAKGRDVKDSDPPGYDAVLDFHNLFPCIDFMADIVFHYVGTIPAKITNIDYDWTGELIDTDGDEIPDTDFIDVLMQMAIDTGGAYGLTYSLYKLDKDTGLYTIPIDVGYQLHECDYIKIIVTIHLPQKNKYQDLAGTGYVEIDLLQWNDECDEEEEYSDIKITKTVDDDHPYLGQQITFTIRAENLGPADATNVMIQDVLPDDLTYVSSSPPGEYDINTNIWNAGAINAGNYKELQITVLVDPEEVSGLDFTQFCLIIDGSGSINQANPNNWNIMLTGISNAISDPTVFPHDGSVELTIIQFGNNSYCANVEIPPTIITDSNYAQVAARVLNINYGNGWTPMGAGIYLASSVLENSTNFDTSNRQVINIVTDGIPNVVTDPDELCGSGSSTTTLGKQCAEEARDYLIQNLGMTADQDEIDAEAVGSGTDVTWLRNNIVWPGSYDWPPDGPGWVRYVDDYTEFAESIAEKFVIIFTELENIATKISSSPDDPNSDNDEDKVTIYPQPCQMVGHWKLDDGTGDTATDSTINANHGTLMPDSPVWTTEGKINGALDFDGVDDYVEIPDDPSLDITDEITLMAWVYPENWDHDGYSAASSGDKTSENAIITKANDNDVGDWNLHYKWNDDDGRFGFRFELNGGDTTAHGINIFEETPSTELNTWYHVAGVYDGSQVKLYINGELVESADYALAIDTNDFPLRIGKQLWWSDIYSMWDGKIDEVKIYNCALTDEEILDEYCNGKTTITINDPGPQYSSDQYGYYFDYSSADVKFTYCNKDTKLRGLIQATGLKPYCTYQLKLSGIPTCLDPSGDDAANEYLGYKGRWSCADCDCTSVSCNRDDAEYEANKVLPDTDPNKECIAAYLVFDYFTADASGNAYKFVEADTSYHVLWSGGGICDTKLNTYLAALDPSHPGVQFSPADKVNGESETGRGGCGGLTLDPDTYTYGIYLTEESFHQGPWASVLWGIINFEII